MDFSDFISAWEGKWLSQRTNYSFEQEQAENYKSDLVLERLTGESPVVQSLHAKAGIGATEGLVVLQLSWEAVGDWGKGKQTGSIYYGFLPLGDGGQQGQLWRGTPQGAIAFLTGTYHLGEDQCLTLSLGDKDTNLTERHWYASPNLRLRTSLIQRGDRYSHSAFYSDIRRLPPAES